MLRIDARWTCQAQKSKRMVDEYLLYWGFKMRTGIRPRVNEAREFLEIAKDFKDPREIIREALSNSWDAGASKVSLRFDLLQIPGTHRKKIVVEIADDGAGMSSAPRPGVGSSEIEGFFNLGDSAKPYGSIGSKGHGTKIFYKSFGIDLETWKDGKRISARTEQPPWETLQKGLIPTYQIDESEDPSGRGTKIRIDGFQAKQKEFSSLTAIVDYIRWFTVVGSFGQYFNSPRRMDVQLKSLDISAPITIDYGFHFPAEQADLTKGSASICKLFGPKVVECGQTEEGKAVKVELVGALLGDDERDIVSHTYTQMGLWLCKDYIRIERDNEILEDVFRGQYYYRSLLIFANCQQIDLTANRNNIRTDQEEYDLAVTGIKSFCKEIFESEFVKLYFEKNKEEREHLDSKERQKEVQERKARAEDARRQRINRYNGRARLNAGSLSGAITKEPQSEAETALLLQAMISSKHPGIDFVIGDYNTSLGVDLIVEKVDKGIPTLRWVELVRSLSKLYEWKHPPNGYHSIVCYELGGVKEIQSFQDGEQSKLVPMQTPGRYALLVGSDSIEVYVLREILQGGPQMG